MGFGLSPSELDRYQDQDLSELFKNGSIRKEYGLEVPVGPFENVGDLIPTDKDSLISINECKRLL